MEVVAACLGVALVISEVFWRRHLAGIQASFARERLELLTRAMHPQVVFPPHIERGEVSEPAEADDFERVGSIDFRED